MQVTDAMARAAFDRWLQLEAEGGIDRDAAMREAVQAAFDAAGRESREQQIRLLIADAIADADDACGGNPCECCRMQRNLSAAIARQCSVDVADEPVVTDEGLEGPGVTDATGQGEINVNEPRPLGNVWDIAAICDVSKETAQGWIDNRLRNGFPSLITLASSIAVKPRELFDLDEVQAWHSSRRPPNDRG